MLNNKITNQSGFSILEMVAVIAIISFTVVGMMSLALQSIQVQRINKYNLTAAMLAQEGIEIIRNRRDSNWKTGAGAQTWAQILPTGTYRVDYSDDNTDALFSVDDIADPDTKLYINSSGLFDHNSAGTISSFSRMIIISNSGMASSTVTARVRYGSEGKYFNYIAEAVLYDWNQ